MIVLRFCTSAPPTVIDWLTDIDGELDGSVQLRCDYRSLVQARVSWYRDGTPISIIASSDPRFVVSSSSLYALGVRFPAMTEVCYWFQTGR